jgi:hypothetical protein
MPSNAAMVTTYWWGAHVEYYFARPLQLKMIGIGKPQYLHEYLWTNNKRKATADLNNVYFVVAIDERYSQPTGFYQTTEQALTIDVTRSGELAHRFLVYRLKGLKVPLQGDTPASKDR